MRATIMEVDNEKQFKPFEFVLRVESVEEARLLFHALEQATVVPKYFNPLPYRKKFPFELWNALNRYMERKGYEVWEVKE